MASLGSSQSIGRNPTTVFPNTWPGRRSRHLQRVCVLDRLRSLLRHSPQPRAHVRSLPSRKPQRTPRSSIAPDYRRSDIFLRRMVLLTPHPFPRDGTHHSFPFVRPQLRAARKEGIAGVSDLRKDLCRRLRQDRRNYGNCPSAHPACNVSVLFEGKVLVFRTLPLWLFSPCRHTARRPEPVSCACRRSSSPLSA